MLRRPIHFMLQRDCALTSGYAVGNCDIGIGGSNDFYIASTSSVISFTVVAGVITTITKATGKRFYHYNVAKGVLHGDDDLQANIQNGTAYFNQSVGFSLNKMDPAKRLELLNIMRNLVYVIVLDQNPDATGALRGWLYGYKNGLNMTAGKSGTGTAPGDRNGYDVTLTGQEPEFAFPVNAAAIATLETPGT